MKYAATNYLGGTPARSYRGLICLNADSFFLLPHGIRAFIVLHEEGHERLNTDDEIKADNYAFEHLKSTISNPDKWAVLSLTQVLPFTTKEQYIRLLNIYEKALTREMTLERRLYDENIEQQYEVEQIQQLKEEAINLPEGMYFKNGNTYTYPIGPYVDIAHEAWTKEVLGMELTAYEETILRNWPVPPDFEAYFVKKDEIVNGPLDEGNPIEQVPSKIMSWLKENSKKSWFWPVVIIAALLLINLLRSRK